MSSKTSLSRKEGTGTDRQGTVLSPKGQQFKQRNKIAKRETDLSLKDGPNDLGNNTHIAYHPRAFASTEQDILDGLQEEVSWLQQSIFVMGRKVMQPRLVAYMADHPGLSYTYSQRKQVALPWTPTVYSIKARVEQLAGTRFNTCLLNLYRDGRDSLSWHSDNEKVYGPTPTIGSVSFGQARDFLMRNSSDHRRRLGVTLGCGDVLIMSGNCQRDWQHSVPKRARIQGRRINLTFRNLVAPEDP